MIRSEHLKEHYKLLPQEQLPPKILCIDTKFLWGEG